jgi:hypothetical protein
MARELRLVIYTEETPNARSIMKDLGSIALLHLVLLYL